MFDAVAVEESMQYPPPPDVLAPGTAPPGPPGSGSGSSSAPKTDEDGLPTGDFVVDVYDEENSGGHDRSPGGVMALFSSGGQSLTVDALGSTGGSGGSDVVSAGTAHGSGSGSGGGRGKEEPLTASQLLATRGMSKRLTLSKKMSAANNSNTGPLKGKRFDLMALPMDPGQQDRRERGGSEHADAVPSECLFFLFLFTGSGRCGSEIAGVGRSSVERS